jgi:monoamine oxidase
VACGGNPGEDSSEQRIGRLIDGYDRVVQWLAAPLRTSLRLNRIVSEIEWAPGWVRISTSTANGLSERVEARAVIVTVPVSLLQSTARGRGAISFSPEIPSLRKAASCLEMGHVQRIVLLLDRALIRLLDERREQQLAALSFLHTPTAAIPVWWTSYPLESGILVGWAGGPAALALEQGGGSLKRAAVASLADSAGIDRRTIDRHLQRAFTHDWSRDSFARGAYSYCRVGGSDANERLSRPIRSTIFVAGEAANKEGRSGTVHGAIESGQDAAKRVLKVLKNR